MSHDSKMDAAHCRAAVWARQGGLCALCWEPMGPPEGQWEAHHRLRRRDLPGWCPCNIVGLHARCHTQGPTAVHDHPEDARAAGLIVASTDDPRTTLLHVEWPWYGDAYLSCDSMVCSTLVALEGSAT